MVVAARRRPVTPSPMRRPRRSRFPGLVLVGIALSAVVLAVNSIASTTDEGPDRRVAYVDQVRPGIDQSTRAGTELDDIRSRLGELGRSGLRRSLERLQRDANESDAAVRAVKPPPSLAEAHGLLLAAVTTRARSVGVINGALGQALENNPHEQLVQSLVDVGRDLAVADRAYQLFLDRLPPPVRSNVPASKWLVDEERWARPEVATFVSTLRSTASLAPVHDVGLVVVTTDPVPVGVDGPSAVLPVTRALRLNVVVANVGNEGQRRVPIEASVTSEGGMDTARQFSDLAPGQRQTVTLTLRPVPVGTLSVAVRVGPVNGEQSLDDNHKVMSFVMR